VDRSKSQILDAAALLIVLVVVGLRPLISESYDTAQLTLVAALPDVESIGPLRTLVLDGLILVAGLLWAVGRLVETDRRYRRCGLGFGLLMLGVAAAVSCAYAGQKRLAFVGAVDWMCCALVAVLLAQLLRRAWQVRLALCVVLASAGATAVECFDQVFNTYPSTEALYAEEREAIWERQGVPLDSPQVAMYENRMYAREAIGFFTHSNVAGAYLVMCGFAAAGLAIAGRAGGARKVAAAVAALGCLGAGVLTNSRGALAAGALASVLWAVHAFLNRKGRLRGNRLLLWGWGAFVLVAAAVIGHGLYHDSLPGRSLEFRWRYWTASVEMAADHPVTGVGSGNFGRHYLQYKDVRSSEEVKNPHNLFVGALSDWGVLGLLGMLTLLVGASRAALRPSREIIPNRDSHLFIGGAVPIVIAIFAIRLRLLGSDDSNYLYVATAIPLFAWAGTFALVYAGSRVISFDVLARGIGFGLLAFLASDMVNFASFEPGTATTAFALFGILISIRGEEVGVGVGRSIAALGATIAAAIAVLLLGIIPVEKASVLLARARRSSDPAAALAAYHDAIEADGWDSTAAYESARLQRALAGDGSEAIASLRAAVEDVNEAIRRDPVHLKLYREKMRCELILSKLAGMPGDRATAVQTARKMVELYPTSPTTHLELAECLEVRGRVESNAQALEEALREYDRALAIDDGRPAWETVRRMNERRRDAVQSRIEAVTEALEVLGRVDVADDGG
jgi:O-Antigen ligase